MKCPQCNYELDFFDALCPQCRRGSNPSSVAPSRPGVVNTASVQALLDAARTASQNAENKRRSISRCSVQYMLRGLILSVVAAILFGVAFLFFRSVDMLLLQQVRQGQHPGPAAVWLTYLGAALPLLGMAVGSALFLGHHWQALANAHPETTGPYTRQAKQIAVGVALLLGMSMLAWQYIDSYSHTIPRHGSVIPLLVKGVDSLFVTGAFVFVLLATGAVVGYCWGQMVGVQNHERSLLPETPKTGQGAAEKRRAVSGWLAGESGARIIGIASFLVPLIGIILYLVYNGKDQEKARTATKGIIAGFSFSLPCIGIVLYVVYANDDEEKARYAAWGLGSSFILFLPYACLRLLGAM